MSDDRSPGIPLRRGLAEIGIIVFGILIALGAEAAWSWKLERDDEQDALLRLEADFLATRELATTTGEMHREQREGIARLLEVISDRGMPAGSRELSSEVLLGGVRTARFLPPRGALESLIASGEIGLIRSDELRAELTGWFDLIAMLNANEVEDRTMYESVLLPVIMRAGAFRGLVVESGLMPELSPGTLPTEVDSLLESLEFESVLAWRAVNKDEILENIADVEASLDRILTLLDQEISSRPADSDPTDSR